MTDALQVQVTMFHRKILGRVGVTRLAVAVSQAPAEANAAPITLSIVGTVANGALAGQTGTGMVT
ncbi:MAG: hypothetical protein EXQ91_00620 [Alphaproteobacteria bacterium]|nr:hypothetical protein [Alphaproteobacteria bacterium]